MAQQNLSGQHFGAVWFERPGTWLSFLRVKVLAMDSFHLRILRLVHELPQIFRLARTNCGWIHDVVDGEPVAALSTSLSFSLNFRDAHCQRAVWLNKLVAVSELFSRQFTRAGCGPSVGFSLRRSKQILQPMWRRFW